LLRSAVIAGALAAPVVSQAATPTLGEVLKASGVSESGYVDVGFSYNNRQLSFGPFAYGGTADASFDLNQVGLTLSATPASGFGAVLDILGGRDATAVPQDGSGEVMFKQAYVQYSSGAVTVMGGRFVTLVGSEVIASTGNTNATRSLLFGYQPLTHTGVRGSLKASDAFTLTAGVNNSIFGFTDDVDEQKTVELQAAMATGPVSLALTGLKGHESTIGGSPTFIDFVGSLAATKMFSLGLNVDHIDVDSATNTKIDGVALYANLQPTDKFRLGARAEYVKTKDDTLGTRKQKEVTLTGGIACASNFDLLADVRYDKDDANPFATKESMTTLAIKGIYKF
jgi:hypothetical protein